MGNWLHFVVHHSKGKSEWEGDDEGEEKVSVVAFHSEDSIWGRRVFCGFFSLIIWLWHYGGKGLLFYDGAQIWNGWIWGAWADCCLCN